MNPKKRAKILIESLPYIQDYAGSIVVVKYGGNAMIDEELKQAVMEDVQLLQLVGIQVVLVHGGGPEISEMLKKTGVESHFVNGLRYTDPESMNIVQMVLCGKVNKDLTALLGGKGVGLSGMDAGLFKAALHTDEEGTDYGLVGDITEVNPRIVLETLDAGYIPVISSVALGPDGQALNVNADLAASKIAASLKAKKLILLTDVPGLMKDPSDPDSLYPFLKVSQVPPLIRDGVIKGGMIPKVDCCVEAIRQGVARANIQDGRIAHSILIELLTDAGVGTMFAQEDLPKKR